MASVDVDIRTGQDMIIILSPADTHASRAERRHRPQVTTPLIKYTSLFEI